MGSLGEEVNRFIRRAERRGFLMYRLRHPFEPPLRCSTTFAFDGDFDSFLSAAKRLKQSVIYLETYPGSEAHPTPEGISGFSFFFIPKNGHVHAFGVCPDGPKDAPYSQRKHPR